MSLTQVLVVLDDLLLAESLWANWEQYAEAKESYVEKGGSTLPMVITQGQYQACLDEINNRQYLRQGKDDGQLWVKGLRDDDAA